MAKKLLKFLGTAILFASIFLGCRNDDIGNSISQNQILTNEAKQTFQNENPQFSILKYTSKIDWENPIVSRGSNSDAVEIPLILNNKIGANIGKELSKPTARLLFRKSKTTGKWDSYYLLISNGNNIQNTKITYNKIEDNFPNKIVVLDVDNKLVTSFNIKNQKSVFGKIPYSYSVCTYLGYWYEDGRFEPLMLVGCSADIGDVGYGDGGGAHGGGRVVAVVA